MPTKGHCIDCGGITTASHVKRCAGCHQIFMDKKAIDKYGRTWRDTRCEQCGGRVTNREAKRCGKCAYADRNGEKNPRWKGSSLCFVCGKPKKSGSHKSKMCMDCYNKTLHRMPNCLKCGKPLSRYKGSITGICQKCYRGEHTTVWNASLTPEERDRKRPSGIQYKHWRRDIFEHDDYQCQCCGDKKGGNLVAHHIYPWKSYPHLRFDRENGVTLCELCHRAFHKKYTQFNNTRGQLLDFILAY